MPTQTYAELEGDLLSPSLFGDDDMTPGEGDTGDDDEEMDPKEMDDDDDVDSSDEGMDM